MHVLISCVGSAGDVLPFLAIGQALARRGHAVELLASPHFKTRIEAAGLGFTAFGTEADYDRVVGQPLLWNRFRSFEVLWDEMRPRLLEAHATMRARVRPGDTVLVGSTLAWQARLLHETHALPLVTVHLSPICLFSATAPAHLPGLGDLSGWPAPVVRAILAGVERGHLDRVVVRGLDRIRHELGLAPVRRVLSRWLHSPQRVVCAWPDWFAPRQADWPPQALTTGFARWPAQAGEAIDPSLEVFLRSGTAPIGFTPGSAMAHGRAFFDRALASCAVLGQRAVLISPFRDQLPKPLPAWAHAVGYAPFDRLLPRLGALVHHGGIGTTAQALAAGIPQGLMPFAHDQFDNALRVVRLGAGQRLQMRGPAAAWTPMLDGLTHDPATAQAARDLAQRLQAEADAPDRIARLIEDAGSARG